MSKENDRRWKKWIEDVEESILVTNDNVMQLAANVKALNDKLNYIIGELEAEGYDSHIDEGKLKDIFSKFPNGCG